MRDWHVYLIFIGASTVFGFFFGIDEFGPYSSAGSFMASSAMIGLIPFLIYRTVFKKKKIKTSI